MKSCRSEIERLTPQLRQIARALVDSARPDIADDLVHDTLIDAFRWTDGAGQIRPRLMSRLIAANRQRLRHHVGQERWSAPSSTASAEAGRSPTRLAVFGEGGAPPTGLDGLAPDDREALAVVVLGRLDYAEAAEVLAIPVATLVTRLVRARDTLGDSLQAAARRSGPATAPRRTAPHLRLVKS